MEEVQLCRAHQQADALTKHVYGINAPRKTEHILQLAQLTHLILQLD